MTKNTCRIKTCGKPSGCFRFCREHRKQNAAKARARRSNRASRGRRLSTSQRFANQTAPLASEDFYRDQAERKAEVQRNTQTP